MTLWLHFTVDAITADELTVALNRRPCEVISIVREGANSRYVAFCRQRFDAGEPRTRYEYRYTTAHAADVTMMEKTIEAQLNEMGSAGWECVSWQSVGLHSLATFKRRIHN